METNDFAACEETEEMEYILRWSKNAKQHFDDGDYDWLCNFINNHTGDVRGIVEIGCGAGYSTLAFVQNHFNVVAIDIDPQAVKATIQLMEEHKTQSSIMTMQGDIIHQMEEFLKQLRVINFPIDVIVLCNPGGNFAPNITVRESKLLQKFGFSENEINQKLLNGETPLLHKWALIYAASVLSKQLCKKLVIVERGNDARLRSTLEQIQDETGARMIASDFREIRNEPEGGILLGNADAVQSWGAALYCPAEAILNQGDN